VSESWQISTVGEVSILFDSLHKTPNYSDYGYPMVRVTDIKNGTLKTADCKTVDEKTFLEFSKKHRPAAGDIIFSRVGSYGNSSFVKTNEKFCLGQNTVCISAERDIIHPYYLFTFLLSPEATSKIYAFVGGASQPTISLANIKRIKVPLPPLPIQQRIAAILSTYDDLIENNTRRIAILEEMARRLYEEWFIHFRFPGHKEAEFIEAERGPVPIGWSWVSLGDMYQTSAGGTPSRKKPELFGGDIRWVKSKELRDAPIFETEETITEAGLKGSSAKLFPKNSVLIAMYGATIGRLAVLQAKSSTNQAICALLPSSKTHGWSYAFLSLVVRRNELIDLRAGAAQQNVSQAIIKRFPMLLADEGTHRSFEEAVAPVLQLSFMLHRKNANLRSQRDLLLPRLVSGEIDVSEAENAMQAAE
jgi:type I restriction enzyme, S subunit